MAWSLSFGVFFASVGFIAAPLVSPLGFGVSLGLAAGLAVLGLLAVALGFDGVFDDSGEACLRSLGGPKAAVLGLTGGSLGGSLGAVLTFQAGLILGAEPPEREAVMLMISS